MEIHQLRYFCAAAESSSFTRAAQRENVSQPSLSQQIIKLEDELNTRLFERLGRKVRLTAAGERFLAHARAVLDELTAARSEVQETNGAVGGRLAIGAIPTIGPYLLPRQLSTFASRYPGAQVAVVEDTTPVLLQKIRSAEIDLALLALPVSGRDLMITRELLTEPLLVVVPNRHPLARLQSVTLEMLRSNHFLLLKEGHCFRDTAIAACRTARVAPNIVFESGHFESILSLVSAGLGISILPEMAVQPRRGCKYLRIRDAGACRRVGLVASKSRHLNRVAQAFVAHAVSS
jgi:LysR family hydrogen peroxide-inducible transcriptional activator